MSHQVLSATDPSKRNLLLERKSGDAAKGNEPAKMLPVDGLVTTDVHPSVMQIGLGGLSGSSR
jgi:hypothetical protein